MPKKEFILYLVGVGGRRFAIARPLGSVEFKLINVWEEENVSYDADVMFGIESAIELMGAKVDRVFAKDITGELSENEREHAYEDTEKFVSLLNGKPELLDGADVGYEIEDADAEN